MINKRVGHKPLGAIDIQPWQYNGMTMGDFKAAMEGKDGVDNYIDFVSQNNPSAVIENAKRLGLIPFNKQVPHDAAYDILTLFKTNPAKLRELLKGVPLNLSDPNLTDGPLNYFATLERDFPVRPPQV